MRSGIGIALASAIALGGISAASAADLAARPYSKAPPPMIAAIYDWSGFYIGANGGWGTSHKCWDSPTVAGGVVFASEGCHDADGGFAGGQIGYRWQAASWVFGLEAQGDWADLRGSRVSNSIFLRTPGDVSDRSRIDGFGLFTAQVGVAWNSVLWYVKGGAAVTSDRYDEFGTVGGIIGASAKEDRWGGTIGTGIEFGFAPGWSLGFEYDHLFMGNRNVGLTSTGVVTAVGPVGTLAVTDRIHQDVDLISVRLNWRFGVGKSPVVARY